MYTMLKNNQNMARPTLDLQELLWNMTECFRCEISKHSKWSHCLWCFAPIAYEAPTITKDTFKEMKE